MAHKGPLSRRVSRQDPAQGAAAPPPSAPEPAIDGRTTQLLRDAFLTFIHNFGRKHGLRADQVLDLLYDNYFQSYDEDAA